MISVARIQITSASGAGPIPSPQLPPLTSGAQAPSNIAFSFADDEELDENELDREIWGYASDEDTGDNLEVEVGSDDFEVVGVIYDSEEEEPEDDPEHEVPFEHPQEASRAHTPSLTDEGN